VTSSSHQKRRIQPATRRRLPGERRDVVDLPRHRGEQRRDRAIVVLAVGDQVQRPALAQERLDVEPLPHPGQH
jgi:hypothetical protein